MSESSFSLATALLGELSERGWTLATAESLTGGALASAIVDIPGSSAIFRGSVVAYASDVKIHVLGVSEQRIAEAGPVDEEVARAMAKGVRSVIGADIGIATTGVAGPGGADGHPAGTVWLAVAGENWSASQLCHFPGGRAEVRAASVDEALRLARASLGSR